MNVLLDTHILIWLIRDPALLTPGESDILLNRNAKLRLSVVSIWELRTKWNARDRNGQRKGVLDPKAALAFAADQGIAVHALEPADCIEPLDPPLNHKDPFDEMLLVHAQRLGARLLTRDGQLVSHPAALVA